jgi:hypothetical protein
VLVVAKDREGLSGSRTWRFKVKRIPNRSRNAIRGSLSVFGRTFALPDGVVPKALAMWSAVCTVVFFGPPG